MKVKRLDSGAEFEFEPDCYAHGVASFRIGQASKDCPFSTVEGSSFYQSWILGYEVARKLAATAAKA